MISLGAAPIEYERHIYRHTVFEERSDSKYRNLKPKKEIPAFRGASDGMTCVA